MVRLIRKITYNYKNIIMLCLQNELSRFKYDFDLNNVHGFEFLILLVKYTKLQVHSLVSLLINLKSNVS